MLVGRWAVAGGARGVKGLRFERGRDFLRREARVVVPVGRQLWLEEWRELKPAETHGQDKDPIWIFVFIAFGRAGRVRASLARHHANAW